MGIAISTRGGKVDSFELVGASRELKALLREVELVAPTPANVVITGEGGVGKQHVARLLHQLSHRYAALFLTIDCAAMPDPILETQLFGHVKGSFAGAYHDMPGLLARLDGGTLCLDEPAAMSASMQEKLLQFLASGRLRPVGGARVRASDVRVIATTSLDLAAQVGTGGFRADLLHRLRVVQLHVLPLRERREDIPVLVEFWLSTAADVPFHRPQVSAAAMEMLCEYSWPGNIPELQSALEWALLRTRSRVIDVTDFPVSIRRATGW